MRVTAIHDQTERKRLDRSVRRAEKRCRRARAQRLRGPIRPVPAVGSTTDTAQGEKRLFNWQNQANIMSDAWLLGECRLETFIPYPTQSGCEEGGEDNDYPGLPAFKMAQKPQIQAEGACAGDGDEGGPRTHGRLHGHRYPPVPAAERSLDPLNDIIAACTF
jgi:hypothetical protein